MNLSHRLFVPTHGGGAGSLTGDDARFQAMLDYWLSRVEDGSGKPGTALDDNLLIACGEGAVRLIKAQREGKAAQGTAEFVRGFPLAPGTRVS